MHPVAQLAHIAGPAIGLHGLAGLMGKGQGPAAPHLGQDLVGKQLHIIPPVSQRRGTQPHHIEPVIEILAKTPLRNSLFYIDIGRSNHPDIDAARGMTADHLDTLLLQEAQQGDLIFQRQFADLIEKQGAAISRLNLAYLVGLSPCERALHMAKQLRLDQLMRHGATVHGHKRPLLPEGTVVQFPGNQLLARPTGSRHQHRQTTVLQPRNLLPELDDCLTIALNEPQFGW